MQAVVAKDLIYFTDAVNIARANLTKEIQDNLAETVEKKGYDAFKSALAKLPKSKERRGLPAGRYDVLRLTWNRTDHHETELYGRLEQLAKVTGKTVEETAKVIITEYFEKRKT